MSNFESFYWTPCENDPDAICANCAYHFEEHSYPLKSKKPANIKHLCSRRGVCYCEVAPNGFCRNFKPKDDKLEVVYHDHTIVLSNTTDGIRIEIKEKKDES